MQGQVPHNEAEQYGDFEPAVLLGEISKLPRLSLFTASEIEICNKAWSGSEAYLPPSQ